MGQRLNIEFIYDDKVIANVYYHWSGYTIDSLLELAIIHKAINYGNIHDKKSAILELVDVFDNKLDKLSGVLDGDTVGEVRKYKPSYKPKDNKDRIFGLLSVARNDINAFRKNEDFRINYDLKNKVIVSNTLIFEDHMSPRGDIDSIIEGDDIKYVDFETFNIDDIGELIQFYKDNTYFKYKDNYYSTYFK